MTSPIPLERGVVESARRRGDTPAEGQTLLVAVSGGVDSIALLHFLRFGPWAGRWSLRSAHFDHEMRPDSRADADWVAGVARAWGVPHAHDSAANPPANEAEARNVRYDFLRRVQREVGAAHLLTAHHADDQAETVLFRIVRGTGPAGLRGIPRSGADGLWRPFLDVDRPAIRAYADRHGLRWREDPTNAGGDYARTVLRNRIIPDLEADVSPGVRSALVGLAEYAAEDEAAWASLVPDLLSPWDVRADRAGVSVSLDAARGTHAGVRARLLRHLATVLGTALSGTGTRLASEFTMSGRSGSEVALGSGIKLRRDFDRLLLYNDPSPSTDRTVRIEAPGEGHAFARLGGRGYRVRWRPGKAPGRSEGFEIAGATYPLTVRARRPGDRVRFDYGSKKVKKLLLEARVPSRERDRIPLLVDASDRVLWVPGVAAAKPETPERGPVLRIDIDHAETD